MQAQLGHKLTHIMLQAAGQGSGVYVPGGQFSAVCHVVCGVFAGSLRHLAPLGVSVSCSSVLRVLWWCSRTLLLVSWTC